MRLFHRSEKFSTEVELKERETHARRVQYKRRAAQFLSRLEKKSQVCHLQGYIACKKSGFFPERWRSAWERTRKRGGFHFRSSCVVMRRLSFAAGAEIREKHPLRWCALIDG